MQTRLSPVPLIVLLFGCSAPPPPYKPVLDTKKLMETVIDPSADVIWGSVATIITASGTEERAPKTAEEWAAVQTSAAILTESGNLLMMVPRAKDEDDWMKMSRALVDAGANALKAAEAKNRGAIFTVGEEIYNTCASCHRRYEVESPAGPLPK